MKGGRVAGLPVLCVVSPFCLRSGPVEWREGCVLCCPRVRIGSGALHCLAPLHIVSSLRIVPVPLLSRVAVFVVGGEVRWGGVSCSPSLSLCSLSQHCWFVPCLCDRVVSLGNSGDGLCWVERRCADGWMVDTIYCLHTTLLWRQCMSCLVVLCCGLWNGGGVMGV